MGTSTSKLAGQARTPQEYLQLIKESKERVQKRTSTLAHSSSPKFNFEQCKYLVDKVGLAIEAAELFLVRLNAEHFDYLSKENSTKCLESFKLLYALSREVESFTLDCCRDTWIQVALTLANMSELILSVGFNLELWRIVFGARHDSTQIKVEDVYDNEAQIVTEKASNDLASLKTSLIGVLYSNKYKGSDKQLAAFILERVEKKLIPIPGDDLMQSSQLSLIQAVMSMKQKDLKLLGKGTSASVFSWMWLGVELVVKEFHGEDNAYFTKEVSIMKGLFHPNVISVFCFAKNNRKSFIVMEKMDGDLESLMKARLDIREANESPFCLSEAVDIMLQIGTGMRYLHESRIIHRDLKSMNILVRFVKATNDSEIEYVVVKVADFGISKTKLESMTNSFQTSNVGTTRWMAPEMIETSEAKQKSLLSKEVEDEDVKYPFKCDIYSFAMVCYEILTGFYPFSKIGSQREIKEMVLAGIRPELPDGCPIKLKDLIERCWRMEPEKRPSFVDICKELRQIKCSVLTPSTSLAKTSSRTSSMTAMNDSNIDHHDHVIPSNGSSSSQTSPKWSLFQSFLSRKFKNGVPFLDPRRCLINPTHHPITLVQIDSRPSPQGPEIYGTPSTQPFDYLVTQVWPPTSPLNHSWSNTSKLEALKMDVIFFEGNVGEKENMSCKETWVQRDKPNVGWPQDWLPQALGGDVRVLLLQYNISEGGMKCVIENLQSSMVFSASWNRANTWKRPIVLVGHSLGCVIIEHLIVALDNIAQSIHMLPQNESINNIQAKVAHAFLTSLEGCFFYAPPWRGFVHNEHILKNVFQGLNYSQELFSNLLYTPDPQDSMLKLLSRNFVRIQIGKHMKLMAIIEGPHTLGMITIIPIESMQGFLGGVIKLEDSNHTNVCKPIDNQHLAYTELVNFIVGILKNQKWKRMRCLKRKRRKMRQRSK